MTWVTLDKSFQYFHDFLAFFQIFKSSQMLPKMAKDTKDSQSRLDFFLMIPEPPSSPHYSHSTNSDSSSSDSKYSGTYTQFKSTYIQPKMSVQTATIKHPITKHCPILMGGGGTSLHKRSCLQKTHLMNSSLQKMSKKLTRSSLSLVRSRMLTSATGYPLTVNTSSNLALKNLLPSWEPTSYQQTGSTLSASP